jgi:hypothetical protein
MRELEELGFRLVGRLTLEGRSFSAMLDDIEIGNTTCCVYAFVIGGAVCRVGSSKTQLRKRMGTWCKHVSKRLAGLDSYTPQWEADGWRERLQQHGSGQIFARRGHMVTTPVGTFPCYLDEESLLIRHFAPPLNRNKNYGDSLLNSLPDRAIWQLPQFHNRCKRPAEAAPCAAGVCR